MRGFVIHLGIFMMVVGLLAAINLYRRPDHIWFIWVLAGWGIGVAAHDLALLLQRTGRKEAIFTDARLRAFFLHLFVYVAVNALLIIVNLLYMPNYYWFLFPLIGWGLLVLAQALVRHRRWREGALRRARRSGRLPHAVELRLDRAAHKRARTRARPPLAGQGKRLTGPLRHRVPPRLARGRQGGLHPHGRLHACRRSQG